MYAGGVIIDGTRTLTPHNTLLCAAAVKQETAGRQAAERAHTTELSQLHTRPLSMWPPDLRRAVEQREAAAAEVRCVCRILSSHPTFALTYFAEHMAGCCEYE